MKNERLVSNNSRRGQRGAIGIFAVMTLMITILFVTLVVDTGRLWMQKRQLQSIADIAAIEAAKSLGCAPDVEDVRAAAQAAAVANGFNGTLASSPNIVQLGRVATSDNIRQFQADGSSSEAVRVVATRSVPASLFAGGLFNEQVLLSAEAVSIANVPIAAFSAGTALAELNTEDSALLKPLLAGLLGSNANIDLALISYKGIADTSITLADLVVQANVANVDELLDLELSAPEFLNILSSAVAASDKATSDAITAVQNLVNLTQDLPGGIVHLGQVLNVPNQDAALNVGINVLSLVNVALFAANKNHAIELGLPLPNVSLGLAKLKTSTSLTVLELPQLAIGPPASGSGEACTVARTAQVRILTAATADALGIAKIDLGLNVTVAGGQAGLQSIQDDGTNTHVVIYGKPSIADVRLTNSSGTGPAEVISLATISLNIPVAQSTAATLDYEVDRPARNHLPQSQSTSSQVGSSLANALNPNSSLKVTILGLDLLGTISAIVGPVINLAVRPLLIVIANTIIDPLLKLLGIQLGVLTVNLEGVQLMQPQPLVI